MIGIIVNCCEQYFSSRLQFLDNEVAAVYHKFNCSELLLTDYRKRASDRFSTSGCRRGRSIYCLFVHEDENTAVKVNKYHSALNSWNEVAEIPLGNRKRFRLIFLKNKVYILGGLINSTYTKSVST